jgi:NTP pyrophosphatase (non-canonical NTP hydrolase)
MEDLSKGRGLQFLDMMAAVQGFHAKNDLRARGGEDLVYRVALMAEELGEISAVVTKGRGREALAEECADLLILLLGTAIAADIDLGAAFEAKMAKILTRPARMVDGRVRVSDFSPASGEGTTG